MRTSLVVAAAAAAAVALWLGRRRRIRAQSTTLPVIDLARFLHGTPADRAAVAAAWDAAFCGPGFCLLVGFDDLLPAQTVAALREAAADFFTSPLATKAACAFDGQVGYIGLGGENVSATTGKPSAAPDLVESYNLPAYQEEESAWTMRGAIAGEPPPWCSASYAKSAPTALTDAAAAYWRGANAVRDALSGLRPSSVVSTMSPPPRGGGGGGV